VSLVLTHELLSLDLTFPNHAPLRLELQGHLSDGALASLAEKLKVRARWTD
jgi:hypothetical protein